MGSRAIRSCAGLFVVVCLGCGSGGRLAVSGAVQFKGAPLDTGTVEFHPISGGTFEGGEIRDGKYALARPRGLSPGRYRVVISSADRKAAGPDPEAPGEAPAAPDRIPPDWNAESNHFVEVTARGPNVFDFDILPPR